MTWAKGGTALLLAFALLIGANTVCGDDLACGVTRVSTEGGAPTSCVTASRRLQVCQEYVDSERVHILLREGRRTLQSWEDSAVSGLLPRELRVLVADLTGDGIDDIAIATRNASSNGMVVGYWTVCVIDGDAVASPPHCVGVEDYGFMGYFGRQRDAGCLLLQTSWRWGQEPGRGSGLYLVGRWLRYTKTGFVPEASMPLVARRYLYSFERERASHYDSDVPFAWFRDPRARSVTCPDPLCE